MYHCIMDVVDSSLSDCIQIQLSAITEIRNFATKIETSQNQFLMIIILKSHCNGWIFKNPFVPLVSVTDVDRQVTGSE